MPFGRSLGLDGAERLVIAWLADNHADVYARASLARLAQALR